jgi:hypothetical protein
MRIDCRQNALIHLQNHHPTRIYTIDNHLDQLPQLQLSALEARQVLVALLNVKVTPTFSLDSKSNRAYELMTTLKYDHRASIFKCGVTERYKVGIAYLQLLAKQQSGVITGHGSGKYCSDPHHYMLVVDSKPNPLCPLTQFDWTNLTGFSKSARSSYFTGARGGSFNSYGELMRQGYGTNYYTNGKVYQGYWINDKHHGWGTLLFRNGDVYQGWFVENQFHGNGSYYFANGSILKANFKHGKADGQIEFYEHDLQYVYQGNYCAGFANGKGSIRYRDGREYQGEWKNGQPHGQGKAYCNGYLSYDGQWQAGSRQGRGSFYAPGFGIITAHWQNNRIAQNVVAINNSWQQIAETRELTDLEMAQLQNLPLTIDTIQIAEIAYD